MDHTPLWLLALVAAVLWTILIWIIKKEKAIMAREKTAIELALEAAGHPAPAQKAARIAAAEKKRAEEIAAKKRRDIAAQIHKAAER